MPYISTKVFDQDLTCAYRHWRADNDCRFTHGHALAIKLVFAAEELDANGWVVDFNEMTPFRYWLKTHFDHTFLVAIDDPYLEEIKSLGAKDIANVIVLPIISCEAFAGLVYDGADDWLHLNGFKPRVRLSSVEVREQGGGSAIHYHASKCTSLS